MAPRICICMWYNDGIREYAEYSKRINEEYCRKYNFDLVISSKPFYSGRVLAWEKVPFVLNLLNSYDYVMWMDADAFFYKESPSILDLIQALPSDKEFILSHDYTPRHFTDINAGVFIIKSTDYSKLVMKEWAENNKLVEINPHPNFHEQGVLRGMVLHNHFDMRNHTIILPYGLLQHFFEYEIEPGVTQGIQLHNRPFILHLAPNAKDQRILKLKAYWEKHFSSHTG